MTIDSTIRPDATNRSAQELQREERQETVNIEQRYDNLQLQQQAQGVACPSCGTLNDPEAMFCASCGHPLRMGTCPNCGSEIDLEADFCEVCHHYIKSDTCSFCGARMTESEVYCHECGNPRGGIVCPVCNTLNDFAFCKQCGTALTEEAKALVAGMKKLPDYQKLAEAAKELEELNMQLPYTSERDVVRDQMNDKLRERVLLLLAKDKGVPNPTIPPKTTQRVSKEELDKRKAEKMKQLSEILERMAVPALPSPVKARNYAMAQKPVGVRLAWVCNWKHAMHSSPCGCAKPQLGGKWVILGKSSNQEIKDDNQ
ncbi:MAG: zinc ribbon domain-containing protein [Prevotella sp.]|nr:zinc ribbon domain-containing protein [Prevotella sp.]